MTAVPQAELAAARERERIAAECYERQQQAQRELEALYIAMTERAQASEERERAAVADAAVLRKALEAADAMIDWGNQVFVLAAQRLRVEMGAVLSTDRPGTALAVALNVWCESFGVLTPDLPEERALWEAWKGQQHD